MNMLEQWQHNEPVSMFVSDGQVEREYRLTFKTMSAYDGACFEARRRRIHVIINDVVGTPDERTEEQSAVADALALVLFHHAIVMSTLGKVEMKDGETWAETRLPESWYDAREFIHAAPDGVLEVLVNSAVTAGNPLRLFGVPPTDAEKKALRLTVRPSAS